jgi:hypothetical protein
MNHSTICFYISRYHVTKKSLPSKIIQAEKMRVETPYAGEAGILLHI